MITWEVIHDSGPNHRRVRTFDTRGEAEAFADRNRDKNPIVFKVTREEVKPS